MSTYTAFRCPNEVLRRAKRFAEGERRSLSNYIIRLMEDDAVRRAAREMSILHGQGEEEYLHGVPHTT